MLSELFYPHGSGGELATYLYVELLRKARINVVVVTNRFVGEPEVSRSENLIVYRLPLFNETKGVKFLVLRRFDVLISSYMRKLMKWADVVYIPKFWFSAIPLTKAYKKPVIVHLHGYIPVCPLSTLYDSSKDEACKRKGGHCSLHCIYLSERTHDRSLIQTLASTALNSTVRYYFDKCIKLADAVICVSKDQKDLIVKRDASLYPKIRVIHNPLPELSPVEVKGDGFGYFGGPSIMKGFGVLCRALSFLNCSSLVVHAANFPVSKEGLMKSLRRFGIVTYRRLGYGEQQILYRKIRGVIIPSIEAETSSYILCEAILRGRIVVASDIGGIPEQVEGCEGVFLFTPGDFSQLAENIAYVRSLNREVAVDFGLHNREVFTSRFSNQKTLRNFMGICTELTLGTLEVGFNSE